MAKQNKNKNINRSQNNSSNPLHRRVNVPRGPKVSFDGTVLSGQNYTGTVTSLGNIASVLIPIDCGNLTGGVAPQLLRSISAELSGITTFYDEFKCTKAAFRWLPQIAPGLAGAGSRVTIAYYDNAETISLLMLSNTVTLIPIVKNTRNAVSWNAWEPYTYNAPLTFRRKTFDVNTNNLYTADTTDRSVQGLVVLVVEAINANENMGQLKLTYDMWLRGLRTVSTT